MLRIRAYEDKFYSTLKSRPFFFFLLPLFFFLYVDAMLSYYFPVVTENSLKSNSILGVIMAASSIVGLVCDFIFPPLFSNRTWKFFMIGGILTAFGFPTLTYLAIQNSSFLLFLLASVCWGIYFELFQFGIQSFVIEFESKKFFTRAWSLIVLVCGIGTVTGPIIGSSLLNEDPLGSLFISILFQVFALATTFILIGFKSKKHIAVEETKPVKIESNFKLAFKFLREVKYWEIILVRIWPAFVLSTLFWIIDATFWTFGGVMGEDLFADLKLGWLILFIFNVPDLINSAILTKFSIRTHKKLYSQICLACAGILLIFIPVFEKERFMIAFVVLAASFFFSSVNIFSSAVFSDLEERSGNFEIYINAISRATCSIGYIIGPLISGLLADLFGYYNMFAIVGVFTFLVCVALIILTPRKLRIPKKRLNTIIST